jgi:type I restriction enzyme S subunit
MPTYGSAEDLYQQIQAEKAQLIKDKKIKKEKSLPEITAEEIPFEIPASWEWVRLGYLVDFSKSSSVKASSISPNAWILDLEDIQKNTGVLLRKKRMGETVSISDKHQFKKGNVLYSKLRPYLNKVIIADEDGYCTSEILCFNFGEINNRYAQLFLMSAFFVDYAMKDAYGVKMPRLGSKQGNNALFPLPPLAEQKRIVAKIEELFEQIDQIKK